METRYSKLRLYGRFVKQSSLSESRARIIILFAVIMAFLVIVRLFILQIIDMSIYREMAFGSRSLQEKLEPKRGEIFMQSLKNNIEAPLILNEDRFLVYADGRRIKDSDKTSEEIGKILNIKDDKLEELKKTLSLIGNDPYKPLFKSISELEAEQIKKADILGIGLVRETKRYYPESVNASHITGFLGIGNDGKSKGQYGLEGYFDGVLRGNAGFLSGERDPFGVWIPMSERSIEQARDGAKIIATMDPSIQKFACDTMIADARSYEAKSASVIIMNPKNGQVLAMCNTPGFDPNRYEITNEVQIFNNSSIFTPYEPGSVFKAITMSAAIDLELVEPYTMFTDKGYEIIDDYTIKNAAEKIYGHSSIKDVLVYSINTGAIFAARKVGRAKFAEYVEDFGFGKIVGIELDTEVSGTIENIYKKGEIFLATASFGQGITATPMQLISSYSVLANHGKLIKPTIIREIRYSDGRVEIHEPQEVRQVISSRTASHISSMLTSVVDEGYSQLAGIQGYLIAGKSGTAQIAAKDGGYGEEYNHTFIGYGPADDASFVIFVKFENPKDKFATTTAVPTFGKIAKFLVEYLQIPPSR